MNANDDRATVGATNTSLAILEYIKEHDGARLSEVVDRFDVAKSTAHQHLTTLREHGYLSKDGERYHLGLKLWHLGNHARNGREAYTLAEQAVKQLAERTGEEAEFDVEENGRIYSVFSRRGDDIEATFEPGRCFYLHTTATGKSILAELPDDSREQLLDQWGLPQQTDQTITTREELQSDLEIICDRGYAINDEELRDGLRAVGTTVHYPDGRILGGISVGGPLYRMEWDYLTGELAEELLSVADELESDIGSVDIYRRS